jgi:hypothetical protein
MATYSSSDFDAIETSSPPAGEGGRRTYSSSDFDVVKEESTQEAGQKKAEMTMDDLNTNKAWIDSAHKIYEHEQGEKFSTEESGYDDIADWFKKRHADLGNSIWNMGATLVDSETSAFGEMGDDVKQAWADSLDIFEKTSWDASSFFRGVGSALTDPTTWGGIVAGFGIGGLAKMAGTQFGKQAALNAFKKSLTKQLLKKNISKEAVEEAIEKGATSQVSKEVIEEAAKKAGRNRAVKKYGRLAAAGSAWGGGEAVARQLFEEEVGKEGAEGISLGDTLLGLGAGAAAGPALGIVGKGIGKVYRKLRGRDKTGQIVEDIKEVVVDTDGYVYKDEAFIDEVWTPVYSHQVHKLTNEGIPVRKHQSFAGDETQEIVEESAEEVAEGVIDEANIGKSAQALEAERIARGEPVESYVGGGRGSTYPDYGRQFDDEASKVGQEIPDSPNHKVVEISTDEIVKGEPVQRSRIVERIAAINTGAGRLFSSSAALPKSLMRAALRRERYDKGMVLEIKKVIKDVTRVAKQENISDETINEFLAGNFKNSRSLLAGTRTLDVLKEAQKKITENEEKINNLLGLTGKERLGFTREGKHMYLTRTFEANNNVAYLKRIKRALEEDKPKHWGKVDAEFITKVAEARKHIRNNLHKDSDLSDKEVDGMIEYLVTRLAKPKETEFILSVTNILDNIVTKDKLGSAASLILKEKKKLSQPILNLLGEKTSGVAKLSDTLTKQNQLINHLEYVSQVNEFAKSALKMTGDVATVKLGGFLDFLPKKEARIVKAYPETTTLSHWDGKQWREITGTLEEKLKAVEEYKRMGVKVREPSKVQTGGLGAGHNLFNLTERAAGQYADSSNMLKDVYTSPQFGKYIENGIDYWTPGKEGGGMFGNTMSHLAAVGQATQTILDVPAYAINTYGAFQSLVANGYVLNLTGTGRAAKRALEDLFEQVRLENPEALKKLAKLKEQGVIDSDLSGEMIIKNINLYGRDPTRPFSRAYRGGMNFLSRAYGMPDTYAKLIAHEVEFNTLKKIFPNKLDDELFEMASERVRNVIPSYSVASPAARQLSRWPIGTYALFPSEMLRTTKNTIKLSAKDIKDGLRVDANGKRNTRQVVHGLTRLTGIGTTLTGVGAYVQNNNEQLNIDNNDVRLIDAVTPEWGKGSNRFHLTGIEEGPDGKIYTRFANSTTFDAQDYLKVPVRLLTGRLLAGEDVTDFEIEEAAKAMQQAITGPYTNPKFLTEALLNVVWNKHPSGVGELYQTHRGGLKGIGENVWTAIEELASAFEPGTSQVIRKYIDSRSAAEIQELETNAAGWPLREEDMWNWLFTGIRTTTMDVNKSLGYTLSKQIKNIDATNKSFLQYMREIKPQEFTPDMAKDIIATYKDLQGVKRDNFTKMAQTISLAENMMYYDKSGKEKRYGYDRVLQAATDDFFYKAQPEILSGIASSITEKAQAGIFHPDNPANDPRIINILSKKFGNIQPSGIDILSLLVEAFQEELSIPVKGGIPKAEPGLSYRP